MNRIFLLILSLLLFSSNIVFSSENTVEKYQKDIESFGYEYNDRGFATAVAFGDYVAVDSFLKSGYQADTKINGLPATFYAVLKQKQATLEQLLQAGANPDATWGKLSLLLFSIEQKNLYLTEIIIQNNADLNKAVYGISPLNYALSKKNTEVAEMLINAGAIPDKTTLKYAKRLKDAKFYETVKKTYDEHYNYFK